MPMFLKGESPLSDDERAAAINLAFLLDITNYDKKILKEISEKLTKSEKRHVLSFWASLTPVTAKAYLCMAEFEERI